MKFETDELTLKWLKLFCELLSSLPLTSKCMWLYFHNACLQDAWFSASSRDRFSASFSIFQRQMLWHWDLVKLHLSTLFCLFEPSTVRVVHFLIHDELHSVCQNHPILSQCRTTSRLFRFNFYVEVRGTNLFTPIDITHDTYSDTHSIIALSLWFSLFKSSSLKPNIWMHAAWHL